MSICSISSSNVTSGVRGRLDERIEVDDDDVDEADAVRLGGVQVVGAGRGAPGCRRESADGAS